MPFAKTPPEATNNGYAQLPSVFYSGAEKYKQTVLADADVICGISLIVVSISPEKGYMRRHRAA
jgi:hypothetical protein